VLVVHGGGWTGRSRADMITISQRLAERGYVAMNISYRFAPTWHFPAQLQDLQQALLWLRANADEQNVMKDKIGVWGYSAGAHLAALLAVTGPGDRYFLEGTRVQALVGGGTPTDLRNYPDGPLTNALIGTPFKTNPDLWRDASPFALVTPDDPPTFLYHGTFDYTVQLRNSRNMYAALQAAKVPAELYLLRGREHIITFFLDAPVAEGIEFLDRRLRATSSRAAAASQ
jgi:acetyl esterase/lipase